MRRAVLGAGEFSASRCTHSTFSQGAATIMLDTDHQEAKEYPLDTQGTVTLSFKVTPLGDVLP